MAAGALAVVALASGGLLHAQGAPGEAPATAHEAGGPAAASGGQAHQEPSTQPVERGAAPAGQEAHGGQQGEHGPAAGHGEEAHAASPWALVARLFNFAILAGGLFYLARAPLSRYLASRSQQIRGELVSARETTERASSQIAEIERKLAALPSELEALRAQGAEEIAAEEVRIREQAEHERQRLLEQTRRDLDIQVRLARRELAAHAADLAVSLARERAARSIEDADQVRLADRYVSQVKNIHG